MILFDIYECYKYTSIKHNGSPTAPSGANLIMKLKVYRAMVFLFFPKVCKH